MKLPKPFANFALVLLALVAHTAVAHELQDNRATLVLRDKTHVSVSLYIAWADALHLALAPQRPMQEFLAVLAAMKPEELKKQLAWVEARFEAATKLYLPQGDEIAVNNWSWPDAKQVQDLLQRRTIQAVIDPGGHFHDEPVEIHADAVAQQEITSVRVLFPEAFQKVLVVSYRPNQTWVEGRTPSAPIRF